MSIVAQGSSDIHFVVVVLTGLWAAVTFVAVERRTRLPFLLRMGSRRRALVQESFAAIRSLLLGGTALVVTWVIVGVIAGGRVSSWSTDVVKPIDALSTQWVLLTFSFVAYRLLAFVIRLAFSKRWIDTLLAVVAWLCCIASVDFSSVGTPFLTPLSFLLFPEFERSPSAIALVPSILLVSLVGSFVWTRKLDGRRWPLRWARPTLPSAVFALLVVAVVLFTGIQFRPSSLSFTNFLLRVYWGPAGGFVPYLTLATIYVGYGFVLLERLTPIRRGWTALVLLRRASKAAWTRHFIAAEVARAARFVVALFLLSIVVYVASGGSHFVGRTSLEVAYQFLLNGLLQLTFYAMLMLLLTWSFSSRLAGLAGLGLLLIVRPPGAQEPSWVPVQANGLAVIVTDSGIPWIVTVSLVFAIALIGGLLALTIHLREIPT